MFFSLPEVWDFCLERIYDKKTYVAGLIALLKSCSITKHSRILDAGCGSGFPALDLLAKGYCIIGVDESSEMVRQIQINAQKRRLVIEAKRLSWGELGANFGPEFDLVYCRGNSLVYAASWEKNWIKPSRSEEEIRTAIQNFYLVLKPRGYLYVDVTRKTERPHKESFGTVKTRHGRAEVIWQFKHNRQTKVRTWIAMLCFPNSQKMKRYTSFSYLLPHEDLLCYFREAGFREVRQHVKVAGEKNYDVFLARK